MCRTWNTCLVVVTLSAAWLQIGDDAAAAPFKDKQLEAAVREVLREPKAELKDDKLKNVYVLEADGKKIQRSDGAGEVQEPRPTQIVQERNRRSQTAQGSRQLAIARSGQQQDQRCRAARRTDEITISPTGE